MGPWAGRVRRIAAVIEVSAIHIGPEPWPQPLRSVATVEAVAGRGLAGDRNYDARRQITIVSSDELAEAARILGYQIPAGATRRQVTITGARLPRSPGTSIRLGEVEVRVEGDCSPCEIMNESVGPGARAALAGNAGITGTITSGGTISVGDLVVLG